MTAPPALGRIGFFGDFACAVRGVSVLVASEPNARLHLVATVAVLVLSMALHLSRIEWCWIVAALAAVWVAEAMNTAIETLTDLVSPDVHPLAGRAKDIAAGAVLLAALGSACIGLLVLGPRVWIAFAT
jgi:diacylglycerol kinase (ATP)